jgi:hypothetical protein
LGILRRVVSEIIRYLTRVSKTDKPSGKAAGGLFLLLHGTEGKMKVYRVGLCYSGYVWRDVQAGSEEEAYEKAQGLADNAESDTVITDWERWNEADQCKELT